MHLSEIIALNRLSYEEYYKYFFSKSFSFYEGKFKTCKIFKFMIGNNCNLQDFRMIILEEVEKEYLNEKEQEYFQRLLPSFFGFNQLNSFLKLLEYRFPQKEIGKMELSDILCTLQNDINGINSYYDFGFTRFNFEHSLSNNISYLLKDNKNLDDDILLKFNEVNLSLETLKKRYVSNFEELQRLDEKKNNLFEIYEKVNNDFVEALNLLKNDLNKKFKKLKFYSEKAKENFINSILYNNVPEHKEFFLKYLDSKNNKLDFYNLFEKQIKDVITKFQEKEIKMIPFLEAEELYEKIEEEMRIKRYKMIFPSCRFKSFSLGDRTKNLSIKISKETELLNTCYIQIYISNAGNSRTIEYEKVPYIIRFDYCYIDHDGNKTKNEFYIDNALTRNCQAGIKYVEKDYYNEFVFRPERFKISSLINNKIENSFISIVAEYKHGINDYTIKDKKLIKLSVVLDEIKQITNEKTQFNIEVTESANCLKKCIKNEDLHENEFVKHIFLAKKLPKLKK